MPRFFARGEGARLWDENGREFLDLEMGLGPTLLGYDHPVVREALSRHARTPAVTTLNHRFEVEVAELITEMIPSAELVVFGKNGSDACTAAARVARAATGRNIILSNGFHGYHDWFIGDIGFDMGLVPAFRGYVKTFTFNDVAGLESLAEEHSRDLAAIIMEPAYRELPQDGYLQAVRRIADKHRALLIFDEILPRGWLLVEEPAFVIWSRRAAERSCGYTFTRTDVDAAALVHRFASSRTRRISRKIAASPGVKV